MTEQEMIEALGMYVVLAVGSVPESDDLGPMRDAVAREMLRQMRFAYACGIEEGRAGYLPECEGGQPQRIDAIAPPDWQP